MSFDNPTPPEEPTVPSGDATPPPPPPGYGGMPSGKPGVDIGAAFSWAIAKFQQHWQAFVALAAVVFVLKAISQVITNVLLNNAANNCSNTTITQDGNNLNISSGCTTSVFATLGITAIVGIIFGILVFLAQIGVYRAALRTTKGETPSFADLTTGDNSMAYYITALMLGIAFWAGFFVCLFIGGVVVLFLFMLAPVYSLDKGQGVGEAFGNSYRTITANFGTMILTVLVVFVSLALGGIFFGLLYLVTLPFSSLFLAHVYRQLNAEAIAA